MDKCATRAIIAGCTTVPVVANTIIVDNERKNPIEIHTSGKTTAGGVQDGRLRSCFALRSFAIFGRDAFSGENTRLLNANMKNITATIAFAAPKLVACKFPRQNFCAANNAVVIAPTSNAVAAIYFTTAPKSNVPVFTTHASIHCCVSLTRARNSASFGVIVMNAVPGPSRKETSPAAFVTMRAYRPATLASRPRRAFTTRVARTAMVDGAAVTHCILRVVECGLLSTLHAIATHVSVTARALDAAYIARTPRVIMSTLTSRASGATECAARANASTVASARSRVAASAPRRGATTTTTRATVGGKTPDAIVNVDLGDRSYPIYIGAGLLDDGVALRSHVRGSTCLVVTNTTIAGLGYLDRTVSALRAADAGLRVETVVLPDGEEHKNLDVLNMVYTKALETRLDRGTTFVALGGGVIGDMTGYAAASYQRGVKFVQIPTTVMAMVDSSVGGKTGVNHALGKNMIGAFYQPECVLIDTDSLKTLPDREFASGIAEIIKYGLIRDGSFFEWLEANVDKLLSRDQDALVYAIERSCINKAEVVAADEKEGGVRATLNLGHTFGHAIETGIGYGEWLHGEAVSTGMCMAADMSYRLGWIDASLKDRTIDLLKKYNLPIDVPESMTVDTFMDLMAVDKKAANGKMKFILLKGELGECVFTGDFDQTKLKDTLEAYVK